MMVLICISILFKLISFSHQLQLLSPSYKIQKFIDDINSQGNNYEHVPFVDKGKPYHLKKLKLINNNPKNKVKDESLQTPNTLSNNEGKNDNGMDELLNIIDKQLSLKTELGEQPNKRQTFKHKQLDVDEELENVDVLLVDLTHLRKKLGTMADGSNKKKFLTHPIKNKKNKGNKKGRKKKETMKPESSLHDYLPLIPEEIANNYKKISEGLARSVLKYINGQEELDPQNIRPNQIKRLQQLKTHAIFHSMTEKEIEREIIKIFFGKDSNTKIYSHVGKEDIIYVPRWLFTFIYASSPRNLRENSKKSKSILPLTSQQKKRKRLKELLDKKTKGDSRKWGKDLPGNIHNYGVPFELQIQGLGQIAT